METDVVVAVIIFVLLVGLVATGKVKHADLGGEILNEEVTCSVNIN